MSIKTRGKLIVIDGIDGSGKATQTKALVERLIREGHETEMIDFPRYEQNFFGEFIGECLAGEYGDFVGLDPHIASVVYAADRFESKKQIEEWLSEGKVVVVDRFVSSNMLHQGGKIRSDDERRTFLEWLDKMEHEVFGIPRPDMIIYLHVPVAVTQARLKAQTERGEKQYTKGKVDLSEQDAQYQENARQSAVKIIGEHNTWHMIECAEGEKLHTIEEIHEEVYKYVKQVI